MKLNKAFWWVLGGLAVAGSLACGSGSSDGSKVGDGGAPPAASATASASGGGAYTTQVGKSIRVDQGGTVATYTVASPTRGHATVVQKPAHGVFLLLHVTIAVEKGSVLAGGLDLKLIGPDGTVYEQDLVPVADKPGLRAGEVSAHQKTDGWIMFDTSEKAASGGRVQIKTSGPLDDDKFAYWQL